MTPFRGATFACLADEDLEAVAATAEPGADPAQVVVVDGSNAVHAVAVSGRDHARARAPEARARLLEIVRAAFPGARAIVVFDDRRPSPGAPDGGLEIVHAPDADEWIVARAGSGGDVALVVTSDRALTGRLAELGIATERPRAALGRGRTEAA